MYRHDVQRLVGSVGATLAAHEPPPAMRIWFGRLADYVRIKHGLGEALHTAAMPDAVNETYAPVAAAVGELREGGRRDRAGLDPADVLLLMGFLWRVGPIKPGRG